MEYYGARGVCDYDEHSDKYTNKISGPFYCWMSFVMTIPQFNIIIYSPESTTKQILLLQQNL